MLGVEETFRDDIRVMRMHLAVPMSVYGCMGKFKGIVVHSDTAAVLSSIMGKRMYRE